MLLKITASESVKPTAFLNGIILLLLSEITRNMGVSQAVANAVNGV